MISVPLFSPEVPDRSMCEIAGRIGIPAANMMITATHTHSGPMTVDILSSEADPAVPKTDPGYGRQLEDGIVEAAIEACQSARPVRIRTEAENGCCANEPGSGF